MHRKQYNIQYNIQYNTDTWASPGLKGKVSTCHAGDVGSIPMWGRFPGRGHGNSLQHSCWENAMDRGAGGLRSTGSQSQARLYRLSTQASVYLAPLPEPLSQEHRGRKRGIGYVKDRNQLYKYSSCGKLCIIQWADHLKKGQA